MNAKDSLSILNDAVAELGGKVERALLVDFVTGNASKQVMQKELQENELFGSGDELDDEHYNTVIDEALKQKLMVISKGLLQMTPKGKKLVQDDKAEFNMKSEAEDTPSVPSVNIPDEDIELDVHPQQEQLNPNTRLKIHLIQAIDRKAALDDFAEQQNLDFDEVLDMVEMLKKSGRKIDLTYFITEVLEPDSIKELNDAFNEHKGDLDAVYNELGDVYSMEEIRLCYIQWIK